VPSVAAGHAPNLREELHCRHCGIQFALPRRMQLADEAVGGGNARVYATEAASPNFVWLQKRFPGAIAANSSRTRRNASPSRNTWWTWAARASAVRGRHPALVRRRKPRPRRELRRCSNTSPTIGRRCVEFARVLAPGGALVLTAPFVQDFEHTLVRARLAGDGTVEHLEPAEFHGDPLGDGGAVLLPLRLGPHRRGARSGFRKRGDGAAVGAGLRVVQQPVDAGRAALIISGRAVRRR
jgi:hypothetical protein